MCRKSFSISSSCSGELMAAMIFIGWPQEGHSSGSQGAGGCGLGPGSSFVAAKSAGGGAFVGGSLIQPAFLRKVVEAAP